MKIILLLLLFIFFFLSCSKEPTVIRKEFPKISLEMVDFKDLPEFQEESFHTVLQLFIENCSTKKAKSIYGSLCKKALSVDDAQKFLEDNFQAYRILNNGSNNEGILTAYYEAEIHASYKESKRYKYPIYAKPKDLVRVDLASIYPELKNYRLRGRIEGNRLVPYLTRKEARKVDLNSSVLCYCDSLIDRFFLEVQGSGKAVMDDNTTLYLGYADQNGHKYSSIGKYMIQQGMLSKEKISLQSIKQYLQRHPDKIDEVLNHNKSMIFFQKREEGVAGALGIKLTPMRSIAVDKRYILLGSMLYLNADLKEDNINSVVFAQDTGGAIKGATRADLFAGSGKSALEFAGSVSAPLKLWLILPKEREMNE